MNQVLGIINFEDATVDVTGLVNYRPVPSLTFMGRYRLIDFVMSNFTNSGISNVQVYVKNKPRSVYEHVGTGRHYNINSKQGKLRIMHGEEPIQSEIYNTDINAFNSNIQFIEEAKAKYVIIAPSYMVYTIDFSTVLASHKVNKADITIVYKPTEMAKESFIGCTALSLDKEKRVIASEINLGKNKSRNISLEAYVMSRELFLELIELAHKTSSVYWLKDIIRDNYDRFVVKGFMVRGLVYPINNLGEYQRANLELTNYANAKQLFDPMWPIMTRTSDSPPTHYGVDAVVVGSSISNGCKIEGTVINSVIGRGVVIKPGAVVINSILLPGVIVGNDSHLEYVIVDKNSKVLEVKELKGEFRQPIYVKRRDRI
jgi:glucose-1-phosphate adenylyltransferase